MEIEFPREAGNFLSKSRDLPVIPTGMGNTHKSRDFANPALEKYYKGAVGIIPSVRTYHLFYRRKLQIAVPGTSSFEPRHEKTNNLDFDQV